jgi:hypothetical protein
LTQSGADSLVLMVWCRCAVSDIAVRFPPCSGSQLGHGGKEVRIIRDALRTRYWFNKCKRWYFINLAPVRGPLNKTKDQT